MKRLIICLLLASNSVLSYGQRKHLINDIRFIDGSVNRFFYRIVSEDKSLTITDSVQRHPGEPSMRIQVTISPGGEKGNHSELIGKPELSSERWYGFSVYAPSDYLPDPEAENISTWHSVPDVDLGERWTSPNITLQTVNGKWSLAVRWDTAKVTKEGHWMGQIISDLGAVKLNEWTDWVFHIKFSYKADGIVEVFRNGVRVYRRFGANSYDNAGMPFWEFGIYKWKYVDPNPKLHKFKERHLFFSSLREGDEKATYKDVAP